jgi:hypothetical protein
LREIERHQAADQSYMDEGVQLLELARNAQRLFANQEPREKRRMLNFLLSNCTWEDGEVVSTFRQPFDLLAEIAAAAAASRYAVPISGTMRLYRNRGSRLQSSEALQRDVYVGPSSMFGSLLRVPATVAKSVMRLA